MPIQGLTGRGARIPEIGKLFKGGKKVKKTNAEGREYETFGPELDHWRFESNEPHVMQAFAQAFIDGKKEPPRVLPVYLPFSGADENFEAWQEMYTAGGLAHRCDGKECVLWLDEKTGTYQTSRIECPTLSMTPEKAKRDGCKPVARMRVIIPRLNQLGCVVVETHSKNDILYLDSALRAYENLGPKGLRNLPMLLCRVQKEISTPGGSSNAKRARRPKWLIEIKPDPEWASLYLDSQRQRALASVAGPLMLTTSLTEEEEEEIEGEAVLMVSTETLAAINKLWPKHGTEVDGKIPTFGEYLKKQRSLDDPGKLTAEEGHAMLTWLQTRALPATKKETVAV